MNAPRLPKYDYRSESARWLMTALWVLALFGVSAAIYYAGRAETARVAHTIRLMQK